MPMQKWDIYNHKYQDCLLKTNKRALLHDITMAVEGEELNDSLQTLVAVLGLTGYRNVLFNFYLFADLFQHGYVADYFDRYQC